MQIKPIGVSDGKSHFEITDIPGGPKDIPGIERRETRDWGMTARGPNLIPPRPPQVGEAITVTTEQGSIRIRVAQVRDDGAMIGAVEILNTPSGTTRDIYGIQHRDSVIVRGMDFVTLVHTD
jgi:hypothetical protein